MDPVFVAKPLSQKHRSTFLPLQGANPLFGLGIPVSGRLTRGEPCKVYLWGNPKKECLAGRLNTLAAREDTARRRTVHAEPYQETVGTGARAKGGMRGGRRNSSVERSSQLSRMDPVHFQPLLEFQ